MDDNYGISQLEQLLKVVEKNKLSDCVDWDKVDDVKRKLMDSSVRKTNRYKELSMRLSNQRQNGKTTAICNAAKNINATVVFRNSNMARMMSNEFGINAIGTEELNRFIIGTNKPVLLDHFTVETLLNDAGDEIIRLEEELFRIKKILESV